MVQLLSEMSSRDASHSSKGVAPLLRSYTRCGPEFIAQRLADWAEKHEVQLGHIQPGKPAQNAYIERFNRTFRTEGLDAYAFSPLQEVRNLTELCLEEYNARRQR